MKTAREVYERSLALLGMEESENTEGYLQRAPHLINLLLAHLSGLDEAMKGGGPEIGAALPQIHSLSEPLGAQDVIVYSLLPLGLAGLLIQEEEPERASFFFNLYQREKAEWQERSLRGRRHKIRRGV